MVPPARNWRRQSSNSCQTAPIGRREVHPYSSCSPPTGFVILSASEESMVSGRPKSMDSSLCSERHLFGTYIRRTIERARSLVSQHDKNELQLLGHQCPTCPIPRIFFPSPDALLQSRAFMSRVMCYRCFWP